MMRNILATAGLLLLSPLAAARAQSSSSPGGRAVLDSARAAEVRADSAFDEGTRAGRERAAAGWLRAAGLYERGGDVGRQAIVLASVANAQRRLGRPDSAAYYYGRALPLLRAAGDRENEALTLRLAAQSYYAAGRLDSAVAYTTAALAAATTIGSRTQVAANLHNLGTLYHDLARPESASHFLQRALAERRQLGERTNEGVTLNTLGRLEQTLGRYRDAVTYFRQSLDARRGAKTRDLAGESLTLNNIGYSFDLAGVPDSAMAYYRQALELARQADAQSNEGLTLINMGRAHLALGHPDSALASLQRGYALKVAVKDAAGEVWGLDGLGDFFRATGRLDSARVYYERSLAVVRRVGDRAREGFTLAHLGEVYSSGDPARAAAYFDSAAAVRATVARFSGGDANRLSFAEQDVRLYDGWAAAWLARAGEPGVGPERAAAAALAAAERGRAQALLDLMRRSSAPALAPAAEPAYAAGVPGPGADLAAEGAALARRVARPGTAALSYLVTRDTLVIWAVTPQGDVRVVRRAVSSDSVAALVQALREGLGVDDASADLGMLATRGAVRGGAGSAPAVRRRSAAAGRDAAAALAELVLPAELRPAVAGSRELVVVPHAALTLAPFAALPLGAAPGAAAAPDGGWPFARQAVRYAPSLTTLAQAEARPARRGAAGGAGALVVGNPAMPRVVAADADTVTLRPLPAAGDEARRVAARLGARPLGGAAASEQEVRRRLPAARLVHLATHGFAYGTEARSRESFVALAPGGGFDGLLTVGELLDDPALALSAELVVLSACQTGLGDLKQAEGTVGLQRAFLGRGARSVLVSLWSVGDRPTELLMRRFYRHWLDDADHPSKAEALRRAQADVRATPGLEHPQNWAAFQLVGAA